MLSPKTRKKVAFDLVCMAYWFPRTVDKEDRLGGVPWAKAQWSSSLGLEVYDFVSGELNLEFRKWPLRTLNTALSDLIQ